MRLSSSNFKDGHPIPGDLAFCVPDPDTHATFGPNRNPALTWTDLPEGTQSLALICHDPVVPTKPDDVNKEGREVPPDLPRTNFFHWVLVDIDPTMDGIAEGSCSDGVVPRGKEKTAPFGRHGINDYTNWFVGDENMAGDYYGYDGPCPPWNDSLVHHYIFTVYALDVHHLAVDGAFSGADVREAIDGHVLASASTTGTYSLNPRLR
ncbi:MAG TPA: YbhB/YbcL family Raf kinase inhibitor-like protein [Actinobacteria bacterium]|nr:YbhB/YbcL family Raf kinase inhibitor-like protein [Actinomycetota bacterium]